MTKKILNGLIIVLVAMIVAWACMQEKPEQAAVATADSATVAKLANPQNCGSCHQKQYKDWSNSHHALALRKPTDSLFLKLPDTIRLSQNRWYAVYKKGNQYRIFTHDYYQPNADFEISYIIGVEPLIQYIAEIPNGKYQCLTFAVDTEKKEYFDLKYDTKAPAGDWLHWTGQSMSWNGACADCHSTQVKKQYNASTDVYNTTYRNIQITCEGCHGIVKEIPSDSKACWLPASARINNKPQQNQINTCATCHARRMKLQEGDISTPFDSLYSLAAPTEATFHEDGQIKDEVFEYHSFTQSKMYAKGVKCSNCHNPHSGKLLAVGNALCTNCHNKNTFDTPKHHFHPIQSKGAACVNCHMPGKFYMQRHYRHDHSLRIPRPDLTVKFNTPNACNNCHKDKSAQWAAKAIEARYGKVRKEHFSDLILNANQVDEHSKTAIINYINNIKNSSTARILALNKYARISSDEEKLTRIGGLLHDPSLDLRNAFIGIINDKSYIQQELAQALNDPSKAVRIQAARFHYMLNPSAPYTSAINDYQTMALFNLDNSSIIMDWANHQMQKNNIQEAIKLYRQAIKKDDKLPEPYLNLVQAYNTVHQTDSAISILNQGIKKLPTFAEFYFYKGLLSVEQKQLGVAIENMKKASELNAQNAQFAYNLSVLYLQQQQWKEAEKYIKKALQIEPNNPKYSSTWSYIQQNKK